MSKKLEKLLKQQNELTAELDKIRKELTDRTSRQGAMIMEGADPIEIADELTRLEKREVVLSSALAEAKKQIGNTRSEDNQADRESRIKGLNADEEKRFLLCLDKVSDLRKAMQELDIVHHEQARCQAHPAREIPLALKSSLCNYLAFLEQTEPELLGLPPKPTPTELRYSEAKARLQQQERLLESIEKTSSELRGGIDYREARDAAKSGLAKAQQALAELGG